jgi:phosphoserine phosphatase
MGVRAKHVFRWDLDKTYLRTEFDTWKDLVGRAFEKADDKKAFPGASALLRCLRNTMDHRICIVSGSPSQMRTVLAAKLALDGIEYDEFVLKNQARNILRGRFRALKSQVPFKLPALLDSRCGLLGTPPETLFGDDAEADAIVYSLYADILAGRVAGDELYRVMQATRAYDDEIERTMALAKQVRTDDAVQRIMIHLDRRSPTAKFEGLGKRLVPIYNYFQAALLLYADGLLDVRQLAYVGRDMLTSPEHSLGSLANSLQDLLLRGRLSFETASGLAEDLRSQGVGEVMTGDGLPSIDEIAWAFALRVSELGSHRPNFNRADNPQLDYFQLVDAEYRHRRK